MSYIKINCEPYDCKNCPSWVRCSYECPKTSAVYEGYRNSLATKCPLLKVYSEEEKETPLSHLKYTKIIIRECDQKMKGENNGTDLERI